MDKLIIGCGYLGRRVAKLWRDQGRRIFATTRRQEGAAELRGLGLVPVVCDVLSPASLRDLPPMSTALYCVGFDRSAGQSMREVYVDGLHRVLDVLAAPERFIYISSTSVYGQTSGEWVDESSLIEPEEESGRIVLEAEAVLRAKRPEAIILRFAGIYGPGRLLRQQAVAAGEVIRADPERWLNLIHVDDGVAAVLAAEQHASPGRICNICDDNPVPRRVYYTHLAEVLGAPAPRFEPPPEGAPLPPHERANRRIANRRMREDLHFTPRFAACVEGLKCCTLNPARANENDFEGCGPEVPEKSERDCLIDGVRVPRLLYGTAWKENETRRLTELALGEGFRGIDTANQRRHYHEAGVGEALAAALAGGVVARDDLFLQTKFTFLRGQDQRLPYDPKAAIAVQVEQSFASSLQHLGVSVIDSYLLHGPTQRVGLTRADWEAWRAMEAIQRSGRARLLGISNVSALQLAALCQQAEIRPRLVQNRCYAALGWDRQVRTYCRSNGIVYQGFSLLTANQNVLTHPDVARIAGRHGLTAAQVIFRFAIDVGMAALTGTTSAAHMRADLGVFDNRLDENEVDLIEGLLTR